MKSDSPIEHFTPTGLKFQDGSELSADLVIFATG
jgi:NAD(P)H-nitrite reductase large subunit